MEDFLQKRTLTIYWIVLFLSAVFLYFVPKYVILTEPFLVPLLLLYLVLKDNNIGKPTGKLVFYVGMFLAFLGDVLQVVINNEIFFISSLVAFMLMNICYSISFFSLHKTGFRKPLYFLTGCVLFFLAAYLFMHFLGDKLGEYKMPVVIYIFTLCAMISLAANLTGSKRYRKIAVKWLLPGVLVLWYKISFLPLIFFSWVERINGMYSASYRMALRSI